MGDLPREGRVVRLQYDVVVDPVRVPEEDMSKIGERLTLMSSFHGPINGLVDLEGLRIPEGRCNVGKVGALGVPVGVDGDGATCFIDNSVCLSRKQVSVVVEVLEACDKIICVPVIKEVDVATSDGNDEREPGAVDEGDSLQRS